MALSLDHVIVPLTFEPDTPLSIAMDRAVQVRPEQWVVVSEPTVQALKLAHQLVGDTGTLHMVHATIDLSPTAAVHGPAGMLIPANLDQVHQAAQQHAIAVLQTLATRFCGTSTVKFHAEPGAALEVTLALAAQTGAQMIVMAASGRSRVQRFVVGSTVDKLARQAPCPVLVVPAG